MTKHKLTHTGVLTGQFGFSADKRRTVSLRETKMFWISVTGLKYRKSSGSIAGEPWPKHSLDLSSIRPIESS